jgi:hypothetical protein
VFALGVIIFGLVRFLSKKITKPVFFKKTETKPKPIQTDRFRFGYFRTKTGFFDLAWFFLVFFGLGLVWFFQVQAYKTESNLPD